MASENARDKRICEIADRIFEIDLRWEKKPWEVEKDEIDKDKLNEFRYLMKDFLNSIESRPELIDVAIKLNAATSIRYSMFQFKIPQTRHRIQSAEPTEIARSSFTDTYGTIGDSNRKVALAENWQKFKEREMQILQAYGVNQLTAAGAMSVIEIYREKIIKNIIEGKTIQKSKVKRSIQSARNLAEMDITPRTKPEYLRVPILDALKGRAAGILILLSNAYACIIELNLDAVGVISSAAGATAAAILPSRDV